MSDDTDIAECQLRHLERENRRLHMAMRDDFAKSALPGVITGLTLFSTSNEIAGACYSIADAMMEARKS